MALPLIAWAGIGLASLAGYRMLKGRSGMKYPGDQAKVGDDIYVAPAFLPASNLPPLPPGTLYVIINVKGADSSRLQGPIVGIGDQKIPAEVGAFVVQRNQPFKVVRNGKIIAENPGAKVGAEG